MFSYDKNLVILNISGKERSSEIQQCAYLSLFQHFQLGLTFFSFAVKSTLIAADEMASGSMSCVTLNAQEALLSTFLK